MECVTYLPPQKSEFGPGFILDPSKYLPYSINEQTTTIYKSNIYYPPII